MIQIQILDNYYAISNIHFLICVAIDELWIGLHLPDILTNDYISISEPCISSNLRWLIKRIHD